MAAPPKRGPGSPRKNPTRQEVKKTILKLIREVTEIPPGYIPASEFARRCGISQGGLSQAKAAGKFPAIHMCKVRFPQQPPLMYYHWEACGPPYLRTRDPQHWPDWFKEKEQLRISEARKQLQAKEEPKKEPIEKSDKPLGMPKIPPAPSAGEMILDIGEARLHAEKLKVERAALELQKAKNEVVSLATVESIMLEAGQTVKQNLLSIAPRLAPLLAAEAAPHKCLKMLEEEIIQSLQGLAGMNNFVSTIRGENAPET